MTNELKIRDSKQVKVKVANKSELPRMRTIKETIAWVKTIDPDSAIKEHGLRVLTKSDYFIENGIVKFAGNKALINIDKFYDFLVS